MAGIKISDLPAASSALLTDVYPVDQLPGPVTYKESNQQLFDLFKSNGEALSKTDDTNVTMTLSGAPTAALLNATNLSLGWSGQLSVPRGGTGLGSVTSHYIPIGNGTSALTLLAPNATTGIPLISQGAAADPTYGTAVVAGGGTGNTTFTAYSVICAGTTATGAFQNVVGLGSAGEQLTSNGPGALPTWQAGTSITPAALTRVDDTNVTLTLGGTPSTALLQATSITAGWSGQLSGTRGGTGVNNGASTATYAGNLNFASSFTTSGAFAVTQTYTGITNVTFPTSGTLATTAQIPSGAALTKTDDTNVTLTLGGSPTTALVNAASLTLGWTGQLGLTRGGTAASLTASNGGIVYSNSTTLAVLAGTATARQMLQSGSSTTPAWSTTTWPATTTANRILYSSATSVIGEITSANSSVLVTDGSGVPGFSTTLPAFTTSSITFSPTTGGIVGTTTNDDVAAGKVGEFISSVVPSAGNSVTTATAFNLTSISLTAGDWDVYGNITYILAGTCTQFNAWISTTSATIPDVSLESTLVGTFTTFAAANAPFKRISIGSTTTVYLSGYAAFSVTATACGGIYARRAR